LQHRKVQYLSETEHIMSKTKKIWTSVGVGASAVALLAASVGVAQAQGDNASKSQRGPVTSLVEDNTLTSVQGDEIKSALETARTASRDSVLASLVADGTITQAQADEFASAIGTGKPGKQIKSLVESLDAETAQKIRAAFDTGRDSAMSSALDSLVSDGTITQEQADAVVANKPAKGQGGKGRGDKGQGGRTNPLVTDGTITQEQANSVRTALEAARDAAQETVLSQLVSDGIITQSQADSFGDKKAVRALIESGEIDTDTADAVRDAFSAAMQSRDQVMSDTLASLVSAGTITQAQADALETNKPEGKGPGMKGRGHGGKGQPGGANQGATGPQA
jgi:competence protein ComGC